MIWGFSHRNIIISDWNFDKIQKHMEPTTASQEYKTEVDAYRGFHIRIQSQIDPQGLRKFIKQQEASPENYKAIWVYIKTNNLGVLDVLVNEEQFQIHHGLKQDIIVYKWLRKQEDLVVPYSMFWVAAGALVIKDNQVLLVQQKSGKRKGKYGLPGGRANRGELISQCAQRQLLEQTGIKATFQKIVFFRELAGQIYNCVDIYYVCLMNIDQSSLDGFKLCERQISDYRWVDLSEYDDFCSKNSFGTQVLVSKHVTKLYKQGRLFKKQGYEKFLDLQKGLCEHRL